MTGPGLAGDELGVGGGRLAQYEEGGAQARVGEDVQDERRPGGVGAVVEGDINTGLFRGQSPD